MVHLPTPTAKLYGLRTRLKVIRQEGGADRSLLRWYPTWQLLDDHAFLDLTSPWEQAWTARHVTERLEGTGAIVELGTWLGATSRAIARGTARRPDAPVHVFDTFVFDDIEDRTRGTALEGRHHDGDDFLDLYRRRSRADRAHVHAGDVVAATWDGPIEFLFVDLAKTWDTWRHVRSTFVPHVVPGAVVVQQDWAHANTPWLHLWHHRWREHLVPVAHIAHSSSVAFRLEEVLPSEAYAHDRLADHEPAEVRAAFRWAAGLVQPSKRPNIAGAHVMLHALHGDLADGLDVLVREAASGPVVDELAATAVPELARRIVAASDRADAAGSAADT